MTNSEKFLKLYNDLPPEGQEQALKLLEKLHQMHSPLKASHKITFNWAGVLKDEKMTSVELQHKANEWRFGSK